MSTLSHTQEPPAVRHAGPARPANWRQQFVALRQEEMDGQTPLAELIARVRRTQGDEAATELLTVLTDALVHAAGLRVPTVTTPAPLSTAEHNNVLQWQREAQSQLRDPDAGVPQQCSKTVLELCRLVQQLSGEAA